MSSPLLSIRDMPDQWQCIHERLLFVQEHLNMAAEFLGLADKYNETIHSMGALSSMLDHLSMDISEILEDLHPLLALPGVEEMVHA